MILFALLASVLGSHGSVPPTLFTLALPLYFDQQPLVLHQTYTDRQGVELRFTRMQFYLSQPSLWVGNTLFWQAPEAFHFLRLEEGQNTLSCSFELPKWPAASPEFRFAIGVDSLHNHGGSQTGALDPLNGMFWTWTQGYIFVRIEGYYAHPKGAKGGFVYHIGGDECYRRGRIGLENWEWIHKRHVKATLAIDLARFFGHYAEAPLVLAFPADNQAISVMGGTKAPLLADNFLRAFETGPAR
ncbi:MAG: hypothetical protein HC913_10220 [Microscillaceae bacterium]|nr:hypothetical protein [Microscillaceae bacterium]